ncbi:hypothetical protein Taro_020349 [Colocasia esculenta]|uniref:Aminotransferase-like plant mobile domain-containing protein n=1 Tax=Colocasia esculenta TaxID=4460 RepID=A0A843UW48_COLES|nr:hypothetical protein [Colocasia esculenta]
MGFGEILGMEKMRADPALTQALRSRWDADATAFAFPWGHMIPSLKDVSRITGLRTYGRPVSGYTYPCYHDLAQRLLELPVERRSSLVPRVPLQKSLGLFDVGKVAGESDQEHLDRLARVSRRELASEPGAQADLDLRRFLVLFLGRLLFATRGDAVHCHFLPLLADLGEVGGYAWGAAFLAHQFDSLGASERQTLTSGFFPFLQVWSYLHLPALGRGELAQPGLVPIVRRWDPIWNSRRLGDQHEHLQEAIDGYPYLDVVWQPYLGEGDEGQPWLVQARPYFGRPGRSFRGLHDTTDWREQAKEQINSWEHKGKAVKSTATTDDAYLQGYALKYGGKVYKSARHQIKLLNHDLRKELERVRGTGAGGASSSRGAGGSPSLQEAQLEGAVLRAEEAQRHLEERERDLQLTTEHAMELQGERDRLQGEVQTTRSERDQLRIWAEAVEAQVAEATKELAALRVQRSPGDQEEVTRLCVELLAQQTVVRSLQQIVTDIGLSRIRSRSGVSASRAIGGSVGHYLAGSSSRRRNEEEERHRQGDGSAQSGRGGGEMLPPPERQEGSGESGSGH